METKRLNVFDLEKDAENIRTAAKILNSGGLVAIPTETVYGLAASAFDSAAVKNIFTAKGRPQDNPLIVHVCDMEMVKDLVCEIPPIAKECAKKFWPGPFTMILPKSEKIPDIVSAGLETVAIRMPSNKVALEIIKQSRLPLAAPSANTSGKPSPTSANHVIADLDGKIDAVVVSENSEVGVESTVITLCTNPPRLLRPGGITLEQLQEVIPNIAVDKAVLNQIEEGATVSSPGMKYKHYSPKARVVMLDGSLEKFAEYVNKNATDGTFALCFLGEEKLLKVPCESLGSKEDKLSQANALFNSLRRLDEKNCKICFARVPEKSGVGMAVYNRLIRAAAFEVIKL